MSKCGKCRKLCPVSLALASGLACGLGLIILSFIGAYLMGVNPPAIAFSQMFLHGLLSGAILGLLVALFYNLFTCLCKKMCTKCCGDSCNTRCCCGKAECLACNPAKTDA